MAGQDDASRPLSLFERQQAQLIAEYEQKQAAIRERAAVLQRQYGDQLGKSADIAIDGMGDEETKRLTTENLSRILAENNISRPSLMDSTDYQRAVDKAVGAAFDEQALRREVGQETGAPTIEAAPAASVVEQSETAAPTKPETKIGSYADLTREHAEIVARLEAGEDLDVGQGKLGFFEDRNPEKVLTVTNDFDGTRAASPETGERRPRFYEELKREHAEGIDRESARSEETESQQGEVGERKLHFFEHRHPSQGHDIGR